VVAEVAEDELRILNYVARITVKSAFIHRLKNRLIPSSSSEAKR